MPRPRATHVLSQLANLEEQLKPTDARKTGRDGGKAGGVGGELPAVKTPRAHAAPKVPSLNLEALRSNHSSTNLPAGAPPRKPGRGLFRKYEHLSAPGTAAERGEDNLLVGSREEVASHRLNTLPLFAVSSRWDESVVPGTCSSLDRDTLLKAGVPTSILSRVSKLLSAYALGFNGLVRDIVSAQPEGEHPGLACVIWQSLLGVVEDNFKVQYRSRLGSIAQTWLEQHSTLQDELSGISQSLGDVHSQNVVLQEAIIRTRDALEQEKGEKQYAIRLREHSERVAAQSHREMTQQQEAMEQMKRVIDDLMMLRGKNSSLQRELVQLKVIGSCDAPV